MTYEIEQALKKSLEYLHDHPFVAAGLILLFFITVWAHVMLSILKRNTDLMVGSRLKSFAYELIRVEERLSKTDHPSKNKNL